MNATLLPSLASTLAALFAADDADTAPAAADQTDPGDCPDIMGTICRAHHCARYLDEAPLVPRCEQDKATYQAKLRFFPNSWTSVASASRPGWLGARRRSRMVVVRYCPACRDAARLWLDGRG